MKPWLGRDPDQVCRPEGVRAVGAEDLPAFLDAVRATGASLGEALGLAAQAQGLDVILPMLLESRERYAEGLKRTSPETTTLLDGIATVDPALAQAALLEAFQGYQHDTYLNLNDRPWVTALPEGFSTGGFLGLKDTGIQALPAGLVVRGVLYLGRTPLVTLPPGLQVFRLDLLECDRWDGKLPEDLVVAYEVRTDAHSEGIALRDWRKLHPEGERA
jgi:hypothetical protein